MTEEQIEIVAIMDFADAMINAMPRMKHIMARVASDHIAEIILNHFMKVEEDDRINCRPVSSYHPRKTYEE